MIGYRGTKYKDAFKHYPRARMTEGEGLYLTPNMDLAARFGPNIFSIEHLKPKRVLVLLDEPMPLLPVYDREIPLINMPVLPSDSEWMRTNKKAMRTAGVRRYRGEDAKTRQIIHHLTRLLRAKYDAVWVNKCGYEWYVLLNEDLAHQHQKVATVPGPFVFDKDFI